jgi:arabinan endo-1,5-alpha-L-arabinosidase
MAPYLVQAQQKWTITPVADAGGYPGSPYFKVTIAGTDRTLAATPDAELAVVPAFTGAPAQLWRIEQLADGTYRLMPKANGPQSPALSAIGSSMPTLESFRADSDRQRWLLRAQ